MATTTTRLGLTKPATTDLVDVVVDLNTPYDVIDSVIPFVVCTSTTRPSVPYKGLAIYETDTHNHLVWSGTLWIHVTVPTVAATASIINPYTNQVIFSTATLEFLVYNGTSWVTVSNRTTILADIMNGAGAAQGVNAGTNTQTTSSASYSLPTTGTAVSAIFLAPPSGLVKVDYQLRASGTVGVAVYNSIEVRLGNVLGSGTVVKSAVDTDAIEIDMAAKGNNHAGFFLLTGLTAAQAYNARMLCRIDAAGTASMSNMIIVATPFIS